jgi:hypothetical protein
MWRQNDSREVGVEFLCIVQLNCKLYFAQFHYRKAKGYVDASLGIVDRRHHDKVAVSS